MPADIKTLLDASAADVLLSQYTATKQYRKHPEISPDDYLRLQALLEDGEVRSDREMHLGLIQDHGKWYYAVIKVTKAGNAIYLQSLRRTNVSDLEIIRERSQLVRPAK